MHDIEPNQELLPIFEAQVQFKGIGQTQPGSPAEGQLHCGDEIHEINGQDTRTLSHLQAAESIKAAGKDLKLTISKSLEADFSNLKVQPQNSFGRQ
ncbi:hypothetical protein TcWFU_008610 [Taenia crassiceps]|uniref:PDZ domain-containing protein n=1 Tax=Taenia crassiceps TaxID=6207 RepID=A0ABR4QSQ7_9CEST